MRLIKLTLTGYRRFEKADVQLDGDVVAFIGPNEAGKTTLFSALLALDHGRPIANTDRTRGMGPRADTDICVQARYLLNTQEAEEALALRSTVVPRWYVFSKRFGGGLVHHLEPRPERSRQPRTDAVTLIDALLGSEEAVRALQSVNINYAEDEKSRPATKALLALATSLREAGESLEVETLSDIESIIASLSPRAPLLPVRIRKRVARLVEELGDLFDNESEAHPNDVMLKKIEKRRPKTLLFTETHRQLNAEYPVSQLADPPAALKNLLDLGEVTPAELIEVIETGDHAHRAGLQEQINRTLQEKFSAAWQQSAIHPFLHIEADMLRVHVSARNTYTPISERSEGLRSFVALLSFVGVRGDGPLPILLVDEAESHLHYDAQADLVGIFYRQQAASQLFYSTHSAGCLPYDIGTSVRVVRPLYDSSGTDTGRSEVKKSIWTGSRGGFSPLMFALGAATFAMVPSRKAVLTEGASDAVLLPTLMREAVGVEQLDFQVAPGLSSVAPHDVPDLDLEAPRVVFLLDGDKGGDRIAAKLLRGGVPAAQVLRLEQGCVIEDYVCASVYLKAVNEELHRSYGKGFEMPEGRLSHSNRPASVARWCAKHGLGVPSKVAVAERALEFGKPGRILDDARAHDLSALHVQIGVALQTKFGSEVR